MGWNFALDFECCIVLINFHLNIVHASAILFYSYSDKVLHLGSELVIIYNEVIFTVSQGFFIFLIYGVCNTEVGWSAYSAIILLLLVDAEGFGEKLSEL
jgi:hypothetical protein